MEITQVQNGAPLPSDRTTASAEAQRSVLTALFLQLERSNIAYCVVGDTEDLSAGLTNDVDIVVAPEALAAIPELLHRVGAQTGAVPVQAIRHEPTAVMFVLAGRDKAGKLFFVQLDVCSHYYREGRKLLGAHEMLDGRRHKSAGPISYFVPASASEIRYYLIKKLAKGSIDPRHAAHMTARWAADPSGVNDAIQSLLPKAEADVVVAAIQDGDWSAIKGNRARFWEQLRVEGARRALFREAVRSVKRLVRPTGYWIALFGPDGAGKSSVNAELRKKLAPAFWRTEYMHLRPRLGSETAEQIVVTDPHAMSPRSWLGSVLKVFYYGLDYVLGYWLRIRPLRVRSTLLIFDRYFHDMMADPVRYRYGGPAWLVAVVGRLLPGPDLFLFLDADAGTIHERKAEVSREETERQRTAYVHLATRVRPSAIVDAAQRLDDVVDAAADIVIDHLAERFVRRFRVGGGA